MVLWEKMIKEGLKVTKASPKLQSWIDKIAEQLAEKYAAQDPWAKQILDSQKSFLERYKRFAATGASFLVSFVSGIGLREQHENKFTLTIPCQNVRDGITNKFLKEYGSVVCGDICFVEFGKSYDFTKPEVISEFLSQSRTHPKCQLEECTIAKATA